MAVATIHGLVSCFPKMQDRLLLFLVVVHFFLVNGNSHFFF